MKLSFYDCDKSYSAVVDEVRIGVLIPRFVEHLNSKLGYNTSIGAVSVAIDRIRRESLLSAKDITSLRKSMRPSYSMGFHTKE
uniref:Uncharacterized protein n=1 Tax=Romanomermis culicivorax TaxID=13658 RepID=A0A915L7Q6_ROMCU